MQDLSIRSNSYNSIEKIVRDANGRLVRATFCVYENGGRIKARLVSAVLIDEAPAIANKILALAIFIQKTVEQCIDLVQNTFTSPYILAVLYISGSQPRAPTN